MAFTTVLPLHSTIQNYAWGKRGSQSEIALMIKNVCPHFAIDEAKPYAELWMGTHPSGPSAVMLADGHIGPALSKILKDNPAFVGSKVQEKFGVDLPFLFKVLSVNTALSIQAHPDKVLAEKLHKTKPNLYKDPNHKPEMAVALTPFEALCGFRKFSEICTFITNIPEFASLLGSFTAKRFVEAKTKQLSTQKEVLKDAFALVMKASKETVTEQLSMLIDRIESMDKTGASMDKCLGELLLRIHKDFPGDVGCFGIYFLNYLQLKPGEAIFLGANEAHAYLYGDCIEIMACSDNTVRAGLTPKFIDVEVLCDMLTYEFGSAESKLFTGTSGPDDYTTIFNPPIPDFTLSKIEIPATVETYELPPVDSGSILLVVNGNAHAKCKPDDRHSLTLSRGKNVFIAASESLQLDFSNATDNRGMLMFRAYCQL